MTFNIKIGVNPISWMNDDLPSLGGEIPLEKALMEGKKIGYQGFELGNKFPRDPLLLDAILRKYELECVSGWYSGHLVSGSVEEEITNVKPHLKLLASNGSKVMVYGEMTNSIQGSSDPLYKRPRFLNKLEWQRYADKLTAFANFTLSHGVRLAYHHHMGAYVETPSDIERLMSLTGNEVSLLFDSGHVMFAGGGEELDWTLSCLFDAMGAMSSKYNDTPEKASRAFDAARDGFVIAGGGGSWRGRGGGSGRRCFGLHRGAF